MVWHARLPVNRQGQKMTDDSNSPDITAAMRPAMDLTGVTVAWSVRLADGRVRSGTHGGHGDAGG